PSPSPAPSPAPAPASAYPAERKMSSQPVDRFGPVPGYLSASKLDDLGTEVMRITDSSFGSGRIFRHAYSMRQPWNADSTLLLLENSPVNLLDGKSFEPIGTMALPGDPVWSNLDPNVMYGVAGNRFVKYGVSPRSQTTLRTFSGYSRVHIGGGEGNISDDDRYVALIGERSGGVDVLVYDIANDKVQSTKRFDNYSGPWGDIDAAHISRSGKYVVVSVRKSGEAYDLYDAQTMTLLRRLVDRWIPHSDMGYTMEGEEALITQGDY